MKKLRKTFILGGIWVEFVQVRLLTNRSDPFHQKIVCERLTESSALYGERLRDFVLGERGGRGGRICFCRNFLITRPCRAGVFHRW